MSWAELLRIALLCSVLDWTRIDCSWLIMGPGPCRIEMHLTRRDWIELDGILNRIGREWTTSGWTPLNWLDRFKVDWTAKDWTTRQWTVLDLTGQHCTSPDCLSLTTLHYTPPDWSAPNCIARLQMKLNKTVLYCTWMYSTGLDHTAELCTALDVTWKDCSGLPKLQWSWQDYIK